MSTITIISHTEHYKTSDGVIVGLGSTITEINHLLEVFDEIFHVAMLHDTSPPASALPYVSNRIKFKSLPALGGTKISDKFAIVWKAPSVLKVVHQTIKKTDYFQFRAPTGIGVFVIPYLVLFNSNKGWFKYAGNWKQENAPLTYSFQRWVLKNQKRKVTINGKWKAQKKQCLSFENPCLTDKELEEGLHTIQNKKIEINKISFCFVGRLEEEKGVSLLINGFNKLKKEEKLKCGAIHIVGDGARKHYYENEAKLTGLNFKFHGFLPRKVVHEIYKKSHVILLPSASEGFPKVIAEAINFGCLPIVSNVSSISHYIKNSVNGYLLESVSIEGVVNALQKTLNISRNEYKRRINTDRENLIKFTYSYYNNRIKNELLN